MKYLNYLDQNKTDKTYEKVLELSKELYKCARYYTDIYYAKSDDNELKLIFKDIKFSL